MTRDMALPEFFRLAGEEPPADILPFLAEAEVDIASVTGSIRNLEERLPAVAALGAAGWSLAAGNSGTMPHEEKQDVARRYRTPPVVEALCEVYFRGGHWDATIPGLFYEGIRDRFPTKSQVDDVQVQLEIVQDAAHSKTFQRVARSRFARADGSAMVQISPAVLVVNHLRPYTRFENWRPLATEMLGRYREMLKPDGIERLGVRYINRIQIPGTIVRMEDYFRVYPQVPDDLGGAHGAFLLRFELPQADPTHQMLVTFASAEAEQPGTWAGLLDLYDVVGLTEDGFDAVEKRLEEAHANIATAFEAAITDRARELFEEVRG